MKKLFLFIISVALAGAVFWSCEKGPSGNVDLNFSTPFLFSAYLNAASLNLDSVYATGEVVPLTGGTYRISVHVDGRALTQGASSPLRGILHLFKPNSATPLSFTFDLQNIGPDTLSFSFPVSFTIQRSDIGLLRFQFSIQTSSNLSSNSVEKTLLIRRHNSSPKITQITMPDSVTVGALPSPDSTFLVTAAVSDSDGIDDIASVRFLSRKPDGTYANCGSTIPLFDDGNENIVFPPNIRSGDAVVGDGVFSIRVRLVSYSINRCPPPDTAYTQRGNYTFIFFAIDKSDAESDSATQIIKVK